MSATTKTPAAASPPAQPADTLGWDTVYAQRLPEVNRAIAIAKRSPTAIQIESGTGAEKVSMSATFDDWSVSGGSGSQIDLSLPMRSVTLDEAGTPRSTWPMLTATVAVFLELVPTAAAPGAPVVRARGRSDRPATSGVHTLQVVAPRAGIPVSDAEKATVTDIQGDGLDDGGDDQSVLEIMLGNWLDAHLADFDHVFASIDIGAIAALAPQLQWLMPTAISYAVSTVISNGVPPAPVFAVMAMTEGRPTAGLPQLVSPFAIPTDADAAFLIARGRILEKLLVPGLQLLFRDAQPSDFAVTPDGLRVTTTRRLLLQRWQLADSTIVDPAIDAGGFSITLNAEDMSVAFDDVQFPYGLLESVCHVSLETRATMRLAPNGGFCLHPTTAQPRVQVTPDANVQFTLTMIGAAVTMFLLAVGSVLGPEDSIALDGALDATESGGSAVLEDVSATFADGVLDSDVGAVSATTSVGETASEETAAAVAGNGSFIANGFGYLARAALPRIRAMLTAFISMLPGTAIMEMPTFVDIGATDTLNEASTVNTFLQHATVAIQWPTAGPFTASAVALSGSLQISLARTTETDHG
jgi:hypothetical protein